MDEKLPRIDTEPTPDGLSAAVLGEWSAAALAAPGQWLRVAEALQAADGAPVQLRFEDIGLRTGSSHAHAQARRLGVAQEGLSLAGRACQAVDCAGREFACLRQVRRFVFSRSCHRSPPFPCSHHVARLTKFSRIGLNARGQLVGLNR